MNTSMTARQIRILMVFLSLLLASFFLVRVSAADWKPADADFRNLIEKSILPVMKRSSDSFLDEEEWEEIAALMEKSGRSIPESAASAPSHSKDGTLRALISSELGETLGEWRVEEQAWYADMLVSIGLTDTSELCIPQEGEITQEQAIQLAADYLRQALDSDPPFEDQKKFLCTAQYVSDSTWRARWYIEFSDRNPENDKWFEVQLSPYGHVDEENYILDKDQAHYVALDPDEEVEHIASHGISEDEAIEIAWDAIQAEYGLDDELRDTYEVWISLVKNNGCQLWNVSFHRNDKDTYGVRIEKETGEVLSIYDAGDGVG